MGSGQQPEPPEPHAVVPGPHLHGPTGHAIRFLDPVEKPETVDQQVLHAGVEGRVGCKADTRQPAFAHPPDGAQHERARILRDDMPGMPGKDSIEATFGGEPVAEIGNGQCQGGLCVSVVRVQRQCAPSRLVDHRRRCNVRIRRGMLVGPRVDERQQAPCACIVRCDAQRALDQGDGLAVRVGCSGPQRDPSLFDEPRRFRVGGRRAEPPPGEPACRQCGGTARQQPPARNPGWFRCCRCNSRWHCKGFRALRRRRHHLRFRARGRLESVADAGNRLDDEGVARRGRRLAQRADHPMHGVVAHHHAGPAALQEFLTAEDGAVGVDEGEQDLHHATFERHRRSRTGQQETRREDPGAAEIEVRTLGQRELRPVDGSRWTAPDQSHRRYIGQGSTLHHSRQGALPSGSIRRERELHRL